MILDFPLVVVFSYILPGSIIWFIKGSSEKTRVKKMEAAVPERNYVISTRLTCRMLL